MENVLVKQAFPMEPPFGSWNEHLTISCNLLKSLNKKTPKCGPEACILMGDNTYERKSVLKDTTKETAC